MTIYYPSNAQFLRFLLGGIPPNSEIALVPSLSAITWVIYARKGKEGYLYPSTPDSTKKWYKFQDSNGTFAPTAKTGYKLVDLGNGTAHQWQLYGGSASPQIFNSSYDARLQPHDSSLTGTFNGTYAYRWCYVKNEVNSAKLIAYHNAVVANTPTSPLYGTGLPFTDPSYFNDFHKIRKATYNNDN